MKTNFYISFPALYCFIFLVSLYLSNLGERLTTIQFIFCYIIFVFLILISQIVLRVVFKEVNKASVLTSVIIFIFFWYGLTYNFFSESGSPIASVLRHRYLLPASLIITGAAMMALKKLELSGRRVLFSYLLLTITLLIF